MQNLDQGFQHKAYNIPFLEEYLEICKKYNRMFLNKYKYFKTAIYESKDGNFTAYIITKPIA